MYKIFKGFYCRTLKGTNLEIRSGTILKSYVLNPSRNSITLDFPDITVEVEDDFDIKDYIIPMAEDCKHTQVEQNEANYNKRINTAAILNYLRTSSKEPMDKHVIDWICSEIGKLEKEFNRLEILAASDEDIIQNALMEYSNQERYNGDVEIANKITDVRNRYLEMLKDKGEE